MSWVWRCYGLLWTLHCHKDRYCDVTMIWAILFHGIRADVSETLNNALTTRMHGDYRPSIDRFLRFNTHSWEITPSIFRDAIVVLVQSQCYSINARAFGPRTPHRVCGLAGDVMCMWVSHSLVNYWIYNFQSFTIVLLTIYLYWIKGILRGYAIRSGRLPSGRLPDRIA